ncbi:inositol monophosphatase family protein [Kribbella sp. NPDC055071]
MDALSDVEVAIAAAEAGAAVVRAKYGAAVSRHEKSATDFATDADLEAEQAILGLIRQARPTDAFLGEEYGTQGNSDATRRWLVDPLCGTLNFAAQTPLFAVNVALQIDQKTSAAAVADPISQEIFWTDGTTAMIRHNGTDHPMTPAADSLLVEINLDAKRDAGYLGSRLLADQAIRDEFSPRVLSSTLPLTWVAAGRRAAYITDGNLRGDVHFAAGLALCQATGCTVTDLHGNPLHTGPGTITAANPVTHARLLDVVTRNLKAE